MIKGIFYRDFYNDHIPDKIKEVLGEYERDFPLKILTRLVVKEPRFLRFGFR